MAGYQLRTNKTRIIEIDFDDSVTKFEVRPQTTGEVTSMQLAVKKGGANKWTLENSLPFIVPLIVGWDVTDEYQKPAQVTVANLLALPSGLVDAFVTELNNIGFLGSKPKPATE